MIAVIGNDPNLVEIMTTSACFQYVNEVKRVLRETQTGERLRPEGV